MTCAIIRILATTITNMLAIEQVENVAYLITHAPETLNTKYNSEQNELRTDNNSGSLINTLISDFSQREEFTTILHNDI